MGLLTLILLIAISILIALSEISFAAAREVRLRSRAEAGDPRAQAFLALRRNSGQVITVIQICLNGVGIMGGIVSSEMLSPPLADFSLSGDCPTGGRKIWPPPLVLFLLPACSYCSRTCCPSALP